MVTISNKAIQREYTGLIHIVFERTAFEPRDAFWDLINRLKLVVVASQEKREDREYASMEGGVYLFDTEMDLFGAYVRRKSNVKRLSHLRGIQKALEDSGCFLYVDLEQEGVPLSYMKEETAYLLAKRKETEAKKKVMHH